MPKFDTTVTGDCGENYVASYLAGFGLIVATTRRGVTGIDLIVTQPSAGKPVNIQVKTVRDGKGKSKGREFYSWPINYAVVSRPDDGLWFACVDLNGWPHADSLPHLFFVPLAFVAARLKSEYPLGKGPTWFALYGDEAHEYRSNSGFLKLHSVMSST
jgi:hypothetical protein